MGSGSGSSGGGGGCGWGGSSGSGGGGAESGTGAGGRLGTAASEWAGTGDDVGRKWWVVDVDRDTGVGSSISTWEVDGWWAGRTSSDDVDLSAAQIELGTWVGGGTVQGEEFTTEKVVSWWDTGWDLEVDKALVGIELVDSPGVCGDIETVFVDLEPLETGDSLGQSIVDLGEVDHDGSLVGGVNGVRQITRVWSVSAMMPFHSQRSTGWDVDNVSRWWRLHGIWVTIANDAVGEDIGNRAVVSWDTDTLILTNSDAVNPELLEDGVSGGTACKGDGSRDFAEGNHSVEG